MIYWENSIFEKRISRLIFGGAALSGEGGGYGFGAMNEADAEKLIQSAWEKGITVFDTAPIYGFGLSEERLGRYLPREAMVITKGGVDWHSTKRVNMSNDPKVIEKMLRGSLKRLGRERINGYMIHWPDPQVDIRRPMEVLSRYQEKGVIEHLGLCNTTKEDLQKASEVATIKSIQSELNIYQTERFDRLGEEWKKYFSMSWGTLDKGILSGRVSEGRTFSREDSRSWAPWWNKKEVKVKIEKVNRLKTILSDYDLSLTELCLNFNLNHYGISAVLVGFKNENDLVQLTSNLQKKVSATTIKEVLLRWNT